MIGFLLRISPVLFLYSILSLTSLGISSCGKPPMSVEDQIALLQSKVDSLDKLKTQNPGKEINEELMRTQQELAEAYVSYSRKHRDSSSHEIASEYLFLASNLYQHNLRDLDRALDLCDTIMTYFPDTDKSVDALFTKGFIYHNILKDTTQARQIFSTFLERFPDHQFAQFAQHELKHLGVPADQLLEIIRQQDSTSIQEDETILPKLNE